MDNGDVNKSSPKTGLKGEEEDAGWDDVNMKYMLDELALEREEERREIDKTKDMFEGMEDFGLVDKAETETTNTEIFEENMDTVYFPVVDDKDVMDSDDEFEMIEGHVPVDEKAQASSNILGKLPKIDTILSVQNQEQLTGRLQDGYNVLSRLPSLLLTGLQTFKTPVQPPPSYICTIPLTIQPKSKRCATTTNVFSILEELIQPDSELRVTEAVHRVEKLYKEYCAEKVRAGRDPGDVLVGTGFLKVFWDVVYDVAAQLGGMDSADGDGQEFRHGEVAKVFGTFMRKVIKVFPE